jgi:hypothetical protein
MFVQISPNDGDVGETLCSLNFASRVRGVELGPARKQLDSGELFKYKQLVYLYTQTCDQNLSSLFTARTSVSWMHKCIHYTTAGEHSGRASQARRPIKGGGCEETGG